MSRTFRLSCLALVLLAAVGCDGDVTVENTTTPSEPVFVLIGGQCRAAAGRIECEDASTSSPAGHLAAVRWDLRSSTTGISQDRRQADPGAEVSFSGLAPDTYEVEQAVLADDGGAASQVHAGLVIAP